MKGKLRVVGKRCVSFTLATTMVLSASMAADVRYGAPYTVKASTTITSTDATVEKPAWNADNLPARDTKGEVSYWYAGNEFYALNQLNDEGGSPYSYYSTGSPYLRCTMYNGAKAFQAGNSYFTQRTDLDFTKTWELIDTDAIWDDQYLVAQYAEDSKAFSANSFSPDILTTIESWYEDGYSFDGYLSDSTNILAVPATGKSWFSDGEKSAVKSAYVNTDGDIDYSYTIGGDSLNDAHLFAPSADEMWNNCNTGRKITYTNMRKDYSSTFGSLRNVGYLWLRSGFRNGSRNYGISLYYNQNSFRMDNVSNLYSIAPAFYLDLENVVMARDASNTAESVANNPGLAVYDTSTLNTNKSIKFLVQDESFAPGFTSSINNKAGGAVPGRTYLLDYSGASTSTVNDAGEGAELVISAALYDQDGKIVYYGPLSRVGSTMGKVHLTIPESVEEGTYTLALFEEQLGGVSTYDTSKNSYNGTGFSGTNIHTAYETDYQSGSVAYMTLNIANDHHTGVAFTNGNGNHLGLGSSVVSSKVSGVYTSEYGYLTENVDQSDIYLMSADSWNGTDDISEELLVRSLDIPLDRLDQFDYYVVAIDRSYGKDGTERKTFWVSEKQIVNLVENEVGVDPTVWYAYSDPTTRVDWIYKLNGNGDVIGLYTESDVTGLIDDKGTLTIPARVAGRTVTKIGGGSIDTPVVPASAGTWTSLSLPDTVTTINDYAFYQSSAQAKVTIPKTVVEIGIKAFYGSSITEVNISEMSGTIGSYAFSNTTCLDNVIIKGNASILTLSTFAFADTSVSSLVVRGTVVINTKAFRNSTNLKRVDIAGNISIGENAFTECTSLTSIRFAGSADVAPYAFNNLDSLEKLYLPEGLSIYEYSFNDAPALKYLETDIDLPEEAFINCPAIETLVLNETVTSIPYNWECNTSSVSKRTVYVKNGDMIAMCYGKNAEYHSPFGSSGNVTVYVDSTGASDMGISLHVSNKGLLSANAYTLCAHPSNYANMIKGTASSVTMVSHDDVAAKMKEDGITCLKDVESNREQTGIEAFYTGTVLTTKSIDKSAMTVTRIYDFDEGEAYKPKEFYVVRTSDFQKEVAKGSVTEEAIAAYEPVSVVSGDLDSGATTGTLSVTVVVFYDSIDEQSNTTKQYFSTPVSIRVEEFTPESYAEQEYGSYDAVADRIVELDNQMNEIQKELEQAEVESIGELTDVLNGYKDSYAGIVGTLEEFVTDNNPSSENGYFGTSVNEATGKVDDVVFIGGNPTAYEDTGKVDSNGNSIYKVSYDVDDDGQKEDTFIVVKEDGVYVVDENGNTVTDDLGNDIVYRDTLGALQRQATAQLAEIKRSISECEAGIAKILEALGDAGYELDTSEGADDQYTQIADAINDMAEQVDSLTTDLSSANSQIEGYASALEAIYSKLTDSTLSADQISGLTNTLNVIVNKIERLQNELAESKNTVTDLQSQLDTTEGEVSDLQADLDKANADLGKANTDLGKANADLNKANADLETTRSELEAKEKEIEKLQAQLDALTATADGFRMTVTTANTLFGLQLAEGTSDDDVYAAIQEYVTAKTLADNTIRKIQVLVDTTNTGDALVADVENAIADTGDGDGNNNNDNDNSDKETEAYNSGYAAGVASVDVSENSKPYKTGYAAGVASVDVSENSKPYKTGYNAGYTAGLAANNNNNNNTGSAASYDEGYAAGVASVDVSENSKPYKTGYNAGYAAGVKKGKASATNTTKITDLTDQVKTLSNQVTSLNNDKTSLSNQVTSLNNDKISLSGQVSSLTGDNNSLKSQVSSLKGEKSSLETKVSSLQNQVNSLQKSNQASSSSSSSSTSNKTGSTTSNKTGSATSSKEGITSTKQSTTTSSKADEVQDEALKNAQDLVANNSDLGAESNSTATTAAVSETKAIGESATMKMPVATEVEVTQKATTSLDTSSSAEITDTNGYSYTVTTAEQKDNAYKIVTWYMNHLEELGDLGSSEIKEAATDETKNVAFNEVLSFDAIPNDEQIVDIENGKGVELSIESDGFRDGELYLVVHESTRRAGVFDTLLAEAEGNTLSVKLPDLSPILITSVSVQETAAAAAVNNDEQSTLEGYDELEDDTLLEEDAEPKGISFGAILGVALVILVCLLVVLIVLKRKRDESGDSIE